MQRLIVALLVIGAVCVSFLYLRRPDLFDRSARARPPAIAPAELSAPPKRPPSTPAPSASTEPVDGPITLAADLDAPSGTAAADLQILTEVFAAWRTNFPHDGNPVGENAEITAALMGKNRLKLALIPPGHRALNGDGELCDRWGTPYRFHQLSGTKMEIRSAGPDKKFGTGDDILLTPQ